MLPQLCETWSQARSFIPYQWSDNLEAHWDTAVIGSSALRAAIVRSLMDEAAVTLGFHAATVFLDLAKFYDSMSFVVLLDAAMGVHFPLVVALLETLLCAAPRIVKGGSLIGQPLHPARSLVA
eukprot:3320447-Pyramimonas_sp.AAC.1